ncbi:MAG: Rid family detoxifying hydrolase [archaeon]|nr:Rid family detoxifying hydrolase [archaeon]
MQIEQVITDKAPAAVGPYSQGTVCGNMVFTAGEIPLDPKDGSMPAGTEEQFRLALSNVVAVLEGAGVKKNNVASVTVYLKDMEDFPLLNGLYGEYFEKPYPARTCVEVSDIPKGAKIMVSAIGVI